MSQTQSIKDMAMEVKDNLSHADDSYFDYDYSLEERSSGGSWETFILLGILALSFCLGVGGNLFLVARRCWSQENERSLFRLSAIAADLILLCLVLPLIAVAMYKGEWSLGTFLCKTVNYSLVVALGMSALSLVIGGSEVIMHRRTSARRRSCYTDKGLVVFMWLAVALTCIPVAVYTTIHAHWDSGAEREFCHQPHEANISLKLYMTAILALFYVFPVGMILLVLLTTRSKRTAEPEPEKMAVSARPDDVDDPTAYEKLRKSVAAALVLFAVCRLPTHITQIAEVVSEPSTFLFHLNFVAQSLFFLNCGINPILQIILDRADRLDFIPLNPVTGSDSN